MTPRVDPTTASASPRFHIYRTADAPLYSETSCMEMSGMSDIIMDGIMRCNAAGGTEGNVIKLLFAMPGMSLTYAWFKSGYPLPLHSHNADCLYYVLAGTLTLGTEDLNSGDGFLVGRDVPYAYKAGPQGVEVLEFRTTDKFDIRLMGKTTAFWDKAVAAIAARRSNWAEEYPPHR